MPTDARRERVRALVIEDDENLAATLAEILAEFADPVNVAHTAAEARVLLQTAPPRLVLTDFALPDGTTLDLLEALHQLEPLPVIVSMSGEADAQQSFALAQGGVRAFLPKPCSLAEVRQVVEEALAYLPSLIPTVRATVGRLSLEEVESGVRRAVVQEALAKSDGSIKGAARLLGISRQRLQYILRTILDDGTR